MKNIFKNLNSGFVNQSVSVSSNKVIINGKTIQVPNGSISIVNNKIFVDGKEIDTNDTDLNNSSKVVNVSIEENIEKVNCNGSVEIKDSNGKYKLFSTVLEEVSAKWN